MSLLAKREKIALLEIARGAVTAATEGCPPQRFAANEAEAQAGVFVTLRIGRRLRGCVGQVATRAPLAELVAHCARAAALEDPRFHPVQTHELSLLWIEISVLSETREASPDEIVIGRHGIVVTRGSNRGLLLPQVAEEFQLNAERFLEEACVKAGIEPSAWKHAETLIETFTADVFAEKELNAARETEIESAETGRRYSSST